MAIPEKFETIEPNAGNKTFDINGDIYSEFELLLKNVNYQDVLYTHLYVTMVPDPSGNNMTQLWDYDAVKFEIIHILNLVDVS